MMLQQPQDFSILYSKCKPKYEDLQRTRAKTPVYCIGQLEKKPCTTEGFHTEADVALLLAQHYQDILPPRIFTPSPHHIALHHHHRKSVRRVKCQDSLRRLVKIHSGMTESMSFESPSISVQGYSDPLSPTKIEESSYLTVKNYPDSAETRETRLRRCFDSPSAKRRPSNCETLFGSNPEILPTLPLSNNFPLSDTSSFNPNQKSRVHEQLLGLIMPETDVGMQLTLDLLTKYLAIPLHRQGPLEHGQKASALQILLMIEAFESLQRQLNLGQRSETSQEREIVDGILNYWLKALQSVYERCF